MAKIDKNKPDNGSKDKIDIRDAESLAKMSKLFSEGYFGEDKYMDFLNDIVKKIKKDKKYKEKKPKAQELEMKVSDTVTDFQRSYLRQIAKQIEKDLRIRVDINF